MIILSRLICAFRWHDWQLQEVNLEFVIPAPGQPMRYVETVCLRCGARL